MSEEIEKKAKEFARKKMHLRSRRATPKVSRKKSRWSPGLLKKVSEIELETTNERARSKRMVVRIEDDTGDTIGWRYSDVAIGAKKVKITEEDALQIAKTELEEIPEDAKLDSVRLLNRGTAGFTYNVRWNHIVEDIPVEGDFLVVKINPETGEVTSVTKNWSVL